MLACPSSPLPSSLASESSISAATPEKSRSKVRPSRFVPPANRLTPSSPVVTHLGATASHGIDLDPILISRATALAFESSIGTSTTFSCADFMASPSEFFFSSNPLFPASSPPYDTILLLSITKWLHLHAGDAGLESLFRSLHTYLAAVPGGEGTLVVEPQEWENYVKATNKNKALKPMFATLKMRPPFENELKAIGFTLETVIERVEGGFSRPLLVWKAGGET